MFQSRMSKDIYYSDKYEDDKYEYRHVMLPKVDLARGFSNGKGIHLTKGEGGRPQEST